MQYIKLDIQTTPELSEILKAEFSEIGFDMFLEKSAETFEASIEKKDYDAALVDQILKRYRAVAPIKHSLEEVEQQNWNKLWESNYDVVEVNERCVIRADFHQLDKKYEYELLINPKMSFGTGHHATTVQMLQNQMEVDHKGKRVFDIGSGTGILAVMAVKLGASYVLGCDIEDWSVENAQENASLNQAHVEFFVGTVKQAPKGTFDIVLANINRNVLLDEMGEYASRVADNGYLLLSGFYVTDVFNLEYKAEKHGFKTVKTSRKDNWAALVLKKEKN